MAERKRLLANTLKFGVCVPTYGNFTVSSLRAVSLEAEKLGFDSIWTTDHVLMPRNSGTPYERIIDSVTTLAYLAAITKRVKLGISVLIIAVRNPVVAAKQLATVDTLSNGRLILGIGTGWNEKEFSHLGASFHDRGRRSNESIKLIRALWNGETSFEGRHLSVRFEDAVFEPRPVKKHLPIWIGGISAAAMKRAAALGDAWHPNPASLEDFRKMVTTFRGIPGAEKKDVCVRVNLNVKMKDSEYERPRGKAITLSANGAENKRLVREFSKLGVGYIVVSLSPRGDVPVTNQIKGMRMLARDFL